MRKEAPKQRERVKAMRSSTDDVANPAYSRKSLLRWELTWIPVEIVCIAMGLLIQQKTRLEGLGDGILFGTVLLTAVVRFRHYFGHYKSKQATITKGQQTNRSH